MKYLLIGMLLFASQVSAGPFCVVTSNAKQCWYNTIQDCQDKARIFNGMCVTNPDEKPQQMGQAPFCVVTNNGMRNCSYYDANQCRQQAEGSNGVCMTNDQR